MEKRFENFEKLKEYFLEIDPNDVLIKSNNHTFVALDWIFTDLVDQKIVEKAIINLLQKLVPNKLESVSGFELIRNRGRLAFQAQVNSPALDEDGNVLSNKTFKIEFTDDKSLIDENMGNMIRTYSFDKLRDEIVRVASSHTIRDGNLVQTRESTLVTKPTLNLMQNGVEQAFDDACKNLLAYYQYLLDEKRKAEDISCIIDQRTDISGPNKGHSKIPYIPRSSELIDYKERADFLESLNPIKKGRALEKVDSIEDPIDGNAPPVEKDSPQLQLAYETYIYHNDLLNDISSPQDGYLFIAEPFKPNKSTRLFYLTPEEYENCDIQDVITEFLNMSNEEFRAPGNKTASIHHTDFETFKERITFYLKGSKGPSMTGLKPYKEHMEKLYGKPIVLPYYKPKKISDVGKIVDKSALDSVIETLITRSDYALVENQDYASLEELPDGLHFSDDPEEPSIPDVAPSGVKEEK